MGLLWGYLPVIGTGPFTSVTTSGSLKLSGSVFQMERSATKNVLLQLLANHILSQELTRSAPRFSLPLAAAPDYWYNETHSSAPVFSSAQHAASQAAEQTSSDPQNPH